MEVGESASAQHRRKTNAYYVKAINRQRQYEYDVAYLDDLRHVLQEYSLALDMQGSSEDLLIIHKNMAVVARRIAFAHMQRNELEMCFSYYETALQSFAKALTANVTEHFNDWKVKAYEALNECVQELAEALGMLPTKIRSAWYSRMEKYVPHHWNQARATFYYSFSEYMFALGASELNEGNFRNSQQQLHESKRLFEVASHSARLAGCAELIESKQELLTDIFVHLCIGEGTFERMKGEGILDPLIEELDMEEEEEDNTDDGEEFGDEEPVSGEGEENGSAEEEEEEEEEITIHVRTQGGDDKFPIKVFPSNTIDEVRKKIQAATGLNPELQGLAWMGIILESHKTILEYNIPNDETIHLYLTRLRVNPTTPSATPSTSNSNSKPNDPKPTDGPTTPPPSATASTPVDSPKPTPSPSEASEGTAIPAESSRTSPDPETNPSEAKPTEQAVPPRFDLGLVYTAVDHFKSALLLSRDRISESSRENTKETKFNDILTEAAALTRLGEIFLRILNDEAKARDYLNLAFQLAQSMGRNFYGEDWYDTLRRLKSQLQQSAWAKAQAELEAKQEVHRKALQKELEEITFQKAKGAFKLLEHLYKIHPPKNTEHVLVEPVNAETIKARVLKAISHYHPDKNKEHGEQWEFLCGEIVKSLNSFYEIFKGGS